jgi:RNA polymerase sigma factor (sigma-70 family)
MVLRVCKNVLQREEAQDAFQATFLILARKGRSLVLRDSLGPWLYGVALRTASCARSAAARRRRHEQKAAESTPRVTDRGGWDDLGPVLHEEVDRLPERYRTPVVLSYFDGLTHEQAAQQLRWPVGTVRTRLSKGRERLRSRLALRGLAPACGLLASAGPDATVGAVVPAALAAATSRGAVRFAARDATAGVVPASAVALTEQGLKIVSLTKWKVAAIILLAFGGGAASVVAFA